MKTYKIKVVELHEIKKTYFIDADNIKEAKSRAKANDWDNANGDEPTGNIERIIIKSAKEIK